MSSKDQEDYVMNDEDEDGSSVCSDDESDASACSGDEYEMNCHGTESKSEYLEPDQGNHLVKGMTMEEMLAIQEKVGIKVFSNKITKYENDWPTKNPENTVETVSLKRANKNRPKEYPMLRKPAPRKKYFDTKIKTVPTIYRDPRFDDLSGKLDITAWRKNYSFVAEKRKNERDLLKNELKRAKDSKTVSDLKKAIQRMENQERESEKWNKEKMLKKQEREGAIASLQAGKKPKFTSRKDKSLTLKKSFMEKLKKDKKIDKYLVRKEKKLRTKELNFSASKKKLNS